MRKQSKGEISLKWKEKLKEARREDKREKHREKGDNTKYKESLKLKSNRVYSRASTTGGCEEAGTVGSTLALISVVVAVGGGSDGARGRLALSQPLSNLRIGTRAYRSVMFAEETGKAREGLVAVIDVVHEDLLSGLSEGIVHSGRRTATFRSWGSGAGSAGSRGRGALTATALREGDELGSFDQTAALLIGFVSEVDSPGVTSEGGTKGFVVLDGGGGGEDD